MRMILAFAALLLGAALPAFGQDEPDAEAAAAPQKRDHRDLGYANALGYVYGWFDLAFEVLDDLEKSRPGPETIESAQILRAQLRTAWANSLKDPAKRLEVLKEVRAYYEDIVQKKPGTDAATAAQLALGDMLLQEGSGAYGRVRLAEDPDSRAQARKEAETAFERAERYFEDLKGTFEKQLDAAEKGGDKAKQDTAHYKLMYARFNYARAVYERAQLYDRGSKDREDRLARAAGLFEEINLEYADQFLGYEAAIFLCLCAKETGNTKQALAAIESALGIKDFFLTDDGKYAFSPEGQDIVARASYFKSQTMNELKDFDGSLKAVKELFELIPEMQRNPLGYAARVEQGKAYAGKGEMKRAQEILEKIVEDDKNGPWAASAREQITLLGAGGGGGAIVVAPDRTLSAAESAIDRGRAPEGLNQIRFLIASLEAASPDEQAKWLPTCWYRLGAAYAGLRRQDEAVACFDALVARFKSDALAPAALFQAAMIRSQLNGVRPNEFDKNAYLETLKKLQSDYPNAQESKASSFFTGMERFSARDFAVAAKEFEKTAPSAGKLYDASLYQAALCHYMNGMGLAKEKKDADAKAAFSQARLSFDKVVGWSTEAFEKGVPKEGDRADTLKKMAYDARCRLAEMHLHPLIKDAEKALAAARAAEGGADKGADPERIATARLLQVQAYLAVDDLVKAEEIVATMPAESPRTAQAEREIAVDADVLGKAAQKAGSPPGSAGRGGDDKKDAEAKAFFEKAANHYVRWTEVAEKAGVAVPARDLSKAANRTYAIALLLNGLSEVTESFSEAADLAALPAASRFMDAAKIAKGAIDAGAPEAEVKVLAGQCFGFAQKFDAAAVALKLACTQESLLRTEKEKDETGKMVDVTSVDVKVAQAKPTLLTAYADVGRCYYELGLKDRHQLDESVQVWARVLGVVPAGHSLWWRAKYYLFASLYEKGDYDDAAIGMKQLKRQNPTFDGGKYGLKDKFEALEKKLEGKKSAPKKDAGKK